MRRSQIAFRGLLLAAIALIVAILIVNHFRSKNRDGRIPGDGGTVEETPLGDRPDSAFSEEERRTPPVVAFRDKGPNGKYGFINRFGFVKIKPQYDSASGFGGDRAIVYSQERWSVIDVDGRIQFSLPPGNGRILLNSNGTVWYQNGLQWELFNDKGQMIVKPTYHEVRSFSDDLAAVNIGGKWEFPGFFRGGKWGFVDEKGVVVIPIEYANVGDFSEGLALVEGSGPEKCIDKTGKTVFTLTNSSFRTGEFRDKIAPAHRITVNGKSDWRTSFFDRTGKTVFTVDGFAQSFGEGLAAFTLKWEVSPEEQSGGFIDRTGKIAIDPRFAAVNSFSEGLAAVQSKKPEGPNGGLWGYVDKTGAYCIEPQFTEAFYFHGGVARVHVGGTFTMVHDAPPYWAGGEWWLINREGKKLKRTWIESSP